MRVTTLGACALVLGLASLAPVRSAAAAAPLPPPALRVKIAEDRPAESLAVVKADIEVVIAGFLAETTTTLTFRNPFDRVLEGELIFPLPEGATVAGYALDVRGELVDGVVVERHEARIAFESELRKRIDPGLVEWVKGNTFRTRVWPIPSRGTRTVRLRYVSELVTPGGDSGTNALYALPLRYPQPVAEFSLKVEVLKGGAPPEIPGGGMANFRFDRWEDRYVAATRLADVEAAEDLLIALPDVPRESAVVERDEDGRFYFVITDFPVRPTPPPAGLEPSRVGVFWDASLSRDRADHAREVAFLEAWMRKVGDVDVDLVVFRDVPEASRPFAVRGGTAPALVSFLERLVYDGGTNLGALRFTKPHDYALLFSDGLGTLGPEMPRALAVPVYAVTADSQANHALLAHLAGQSGGAYLGLQRLDAGAAVATVGDGGFGLQAIDHDARAIADLTPRGPRRLSGRLMVAGRLLAAETTVALRYGEGAESSARSYTLRQSDARPGRLASHFWAQQRVAELSVFPEKNHDELLRLGRRFGIVTPGTSLIVLEALEQYLEHRIEPPRSRAALRAEYLRRTEPAQRAEKRAAADKLSFVLALWQRRVQWWEREFKYGTGFRAKDPLESPQLMEGGVVGGVEGGVPGGVVGGVVGGTAAAPPPPRAQRIGGQTVDATVMSREEMAAAMSAPAFAKEGETVRARSSGAAAIVLKPWDPATPYLDALRRAGPAGAYDTFLGERREYGNSPAFYLDCADHFLRAGQRAIGLRVLSDVVELQLEEPRLLRIAAHRLQQEGELALAVDLFEKVLSLRPEEPQSLRDLALALEARADARRVKAGQGSPSIAADYVRAVELLNRVVLGRWDGRFPEIEVLALEEANRIIAVVERDPGFGRPSFPIDPRLRTLLDTDLRIVMTWDTDLTDMDLWVTEPSGEKCYYGHALTQTGGLISQDFTGGYGPEEYLVHRAMAGEYRIQSNFYGSRSQSLTGAITIQATVITDFGRPNEARRSLTLRLTGAREVIDVGTARFGPTPAKTTH
jgi:Ca-activated chloride channel family protein